jgi:hypothetical protein
MDFDFSLIINQLLVLFTVMFVGYVMGKLNILDGHANKKLTSFVVYVSTPALIISGMTDRSVVNADVNLIQIVGISVICYIFLFILTLFTPQLLRVPKEDYGIYKFMVMFSNVGFMGFPVISSIYGRGAILYAALFNLPFNLLLYTLGIYFVSMHTSEKKFDFNWKTFLNAGVVAVAIGLFLFVTKLRLPMFIEDSIVMVGDLTTPLAMLIIGVSLTNIPFKSVLLNTRIYIFSFLKLIVYPAITMLIVSSLIDHEMLIGVAVVIVGMPVAANAVMLSKEFEGNEKVAAEGVFMTTLISIVSIPFLVYLLTL